MNVQTTDGNSGLSCWDAPSRFESVEALEDFLSHPSIDVVESVACLDGNVMILGAGGKMGPTLAMLAQRAVLESKSDKQIIGVSRFSDRALADRLSRMGVRTIACDLMDETALAALPDVPNIVYMVGTKFGATAQEPRTWAINAFLPTRVIDRFRHSRFVVFSSGNVYPFVPAAHGGCTEITPPAPVGEYAQSVLGRERMFQHFSVDYGIPCVLLRLNYAVEMRYGVLLDIARKVWAGDPIKLEMGYVNVIWQGDANAYALRAFQLVDCPPRVLNVTGPETLSVRALALHFGRLLDRAPVFVGEERGEALLSNAQEIHALFGYPRVPIGMVIEWVARWLMDGGPVLGKPTKFEVRDGRF